MEIVDNFIILPFAEECKALVFVCCVAEHRVLFKSNERGQPCTTKQCSQSHDPTHRAGLRAAEK